MKLTAKQRALIRQARAKRRLEEIQAADRDRWAKGDYRKRRYR